MAVYLDHISKTYGKKQVLNRFCARLEDGRIYCLMGQSGIGKTTLLRILMGLEPPSGGTVSFWSAGPDGEREKRMPYISAVFQEDRLIDFADALKNVRLAAGREREAAFSPEEVLEQLLERAEWHKPVRELSGGMRRRVAVARALAAPSEFLVMDEPFTGLDEENKRKTIQAVLRFRMGRTLLAVTHREEDVKLLGAQKIVLEG